MSIFASIEKMGHEQVVFCHDPQSGLRAIIAIHDTTLGPGLGGCRFWPYANDEEALFDVLRLARGMTYKSAVAGLALGGGKAVIIGDPKNLRSEALFRAFGRFVDSLGGRYISAEDVNTSVADLEYAALETRHVTGLRRGSGDPSPVTALGVFHGIRAAALAGLGKDSLKGLKVAVQGVGAVGSYLCGYLAEAGASLVVADLDSARAANMAERYGARLSDVATIHKEKVDILAPCALGAGLNDKTIPDIAAKIVAGGANNQLLDEDRHGAMLKARGILYAPDYVINAGGIINIYEELGGYNRERAEARASGIYDTLLAVFREAETLREPPHVASARIAERRIAKARALPALRRDFAMVDRRPR